MGVASHQCGMYDTLHPFANSTTSWKLFNKQQRFCGLATAYLSSGGSFALDLSRRKAVQHWSIWPWVILSLGFTQLDSSLANLSRLETAWCLRSAVTAIAAPPKYLGNN